MNFKPIILTLGLLCFIKHQSLAQVYGYEAFSSCGSFCNSNNYFAALNNPSEMLNSNTTLSYSISNPYGLRDLYSSGLNLQTSSKQIAMGMTWQNQGNARGRRWNDVLYATGWSGHSHSLVSIICFLHLFLFFVCGIASVMSV